MTANHLFQILHFIVLTERIPFIGTDVSKQIRQISVLREFTADTNSNTAEN